MHFYLLLDVPIAIGMPDVFLFTNLLTLQRYLKFWVMSED
jgi:hypothetical protein